MVVIFLIKVSLNVEFCVFLHPLKCKHILPLAVFTFIKAKIAVILIKSREN